MSELGLAWTFLLSGEVQRKRNCRAQGPQECPSLASLVTLMEQLLQSITIFICMSVTNKDII